MIFYLTIEHTRLIWKLILFVVHRRKELDNEVVYEDPDLHLDTHPPRRDPAIELKQCPAYETAKFKPEVDVNVELERCPAYMTVK